MHPQGSMTSSQCTYTLARKNPVQIWSKQWLSAKLLAIRKRLHGVLVADGCPGGTRDRNDGRVTLAAGDQKRRPCALYRPRQLLTEGTDGWVVFDSPTWAESGRAERAGQFDRGPLLHRVDRTKFGAAPDAERSTPDRTYGAAPRGGGGREFQFAMRYYYSLPRPLFRVTESVLYSRRVRSIEIKAVFDGGRSMVPVQCEAGERTEQECS